MIARMVIENAMGVVTVAASIAMVVMVMAMSTICMVVMANENDADHNTRQ